MKIVSRTIEILVVEDSPSDAQLLLEALEGHRIKSKVQVVDDGDVALAYLRKEEPWSEAKTPDLVFLDLNLPRKDGREVLEEIKADPKLCMIPFIIMTTSTSQLDVFRCYKLHASSYIVKSPNIDQFFQDITTLGDYWFKIVQLPPRIQA